MDLTDFVERLVYCRKCHRSIGRLLHDPHEPQGGFHLMYAAPLEMPSHGQPWLLGRHRKPKTKALLATTVKGGSTVRPSGEGNFSTSATLIPITERVQCACGFVTSLNFLRKQDFG